MRQVILNFREANSPRYKMISNKQTGPGSLYLEINEQANVQQNTSMQALFNHFFFKVHILDEQEIPSLSTLPTDFISVNPHVRYRRLIGIEEIENQPEVN